MKRIIDLNVRPYPSPEGDIDAVIKPAYGWHPGRPILHEPISKGRNISDILSFLT